MNKPLEDEKGGQNDNEDKAADGGGDRLVYHA